MKNFFNHIGRFFRKNWLILTTATAALFLGATGGFAAGASMNSNITDSQNIPNFEQRNFDQKPPTGAMPDTESGASTGAESNDDSDTNSNSNTMTG